MAPCLMMGSSEVVTFLKARLVLRRGFSVLGVTRSKALSKYSSAPYVSRVSGGGACNASGRSACHAVLYLSFCS